MLFQSLYTSIALVVTLAVSAHASTIVAFGNTDCTGSVGASVQCDGSCHDFTNRHSLKISGGGTHCVTYFESTGCNFVEGQGGTDIINSGQCQHVNTGRPVKSFICAPDSVCLV